MRLLSKHLGAQVALPVITCDLKHTLAWELLNSPLPCGSTGHGRGGLPGGTALFFNTSRPDFRRRMGRILQSPSASEGKSMPLAGARTLKLALFDEDRRRP